MALSVYTFVCIYVYVCIHWRKNYNEFRDELHIHIPDYVRIWLQDWVGQSGPPMFASLVDPLVVNMVDGSLQFVTKQLTCPQNVG